MQASARCLLTYHHSQHHHHRIIITGRICRRQLCRYFVYSPADFGVFRPAGATRCTDQIKPCQIWPWSVQGWRFTAPKTEKNWNFTNIITPKGRVTCTIFTKFTIFMCVLSVHNFAKFGCFISINDKIIINLLRWGCFQPNFRRTLAAKLWMEPKKVWGWNDGTDHLYHQQEIVYKLMQQPRTLNEMCSTIYQTECLATRRPCGQFAS